MNSPPIFRIVVARENAWETAVALANARNDLERVAIRGALDFRAGVVTRRRQHHFRCIEGAGS
jgi:hypothetical protein